MLTINLFNMKGRVNKKAQILQYQRFGLLYRGADLNCRPSGYESDALTS